MHIDSVYIAARFSRKDEMREHAERLRAAGIAVTSEWLKETIPANTDLGDDPPDYYEAAAHTDMHNIAAAGALLFFSEDPLVGTPRGGRHVEFGYALGLSKPIFVIGDPENIFHYLPKYVRHFASLDEFMEATR